MKFNKAIATILLSAAFTCPAQKINPITQAMLNGYTAVLKENPKDFETLYERAAQYYSLSQYDNALNDLTKALEYTPVKEKDLRLSELSLLTDVALQTENFDLALKAVNEALELDPQNYANIYKKGNVLLYLNEPEQAYRTFSSLQSLKSRSQEAYFGMAKALIMQKNFTEAQDLMKEAENADPTNALTYCRLGDLYMDMEQPENAATNYLVGFNLSRNNSRPLESLISLASANYDAVATALDFAIEKSDNKIPNLFLKGNIACESGNYSQADAAFTQLLTYPEAHIGSIYLQQARAKLALNQLQEASEAVANAIKTGADADAYILKSQIDVAQGHPAEGVVAAQKAVALAPGNAEYLVTKAEAQIAVKDGKGAIESLNEAIMISPENAKALLLRAFTNENLVNNAKATIGDFNRIILEEAKDFPTITYKAIAQAKAGKKLDADATVEKGLESKIDKDSLYWASVYYAQTGNLEKAQELLQKAIYAGYQNQFEVKASSTPWLTVSPIRHLVR